MLEARRVKAIAVCLLVAGCTADVEIITEDQGATSGASVTTALKGLSNCQGQASSSIPADHKYIITTFGGPGDAQAMSCGGYANGTTWYAASRQRYGCGSRIKLEANGKCVVVKTDDYGPDVCVEKAAGMPIIDVSPLASKALFGVSGAGWSDRMVVTVTEVAATTPLGLCQPDGGGGGGGGPTTTTCASTTLDRDVESGTCVQSADDGAMYQCNAGNWVAKSGTTGCTSTYRWCNSATLGKNVPPRTCVQAASNSVWYQCNGQGWVTPVNVAAGTGPIGNCSSMNEL